ncbi:MAG: DMT family transporter [Parvibaculaceae bacterium]
MLAGLLYLGSGAGLSLYLLFKRLNGNRTDAPLTRSDVPWLALVVVFGGVLGPLLLMTGLSHASASSASLLLNLEGLATMVIAWLVFRENVDRRLLIGAGAILLGSIVLTWQGRSISFGWGETAIALACLCWGIDNNLTRKLSAADPVATSAIKGVAAGSVNLVLAFAQGTSPPPASGIAAAALLGLLGYGVSLVLFVIALRHLGTARTGAYYSTAPFLGAALSVALLGDPVTIQLIAAAALMAIGVWLHLTEQHEHEHAHAATAHVHRHAHDEHHRHQHGPDDPVGEPHSHWHEHVPLVHRHRHYPDLHHHHTH